MDQWKMALRWCYHGSCKLVTIKLHNSYSYIIVIELHKLHMYTVSHMASCIHYNSCNLSDNTHIHKNMLSCNELQMVIATQKPSCKASCKSFHFPIYVHYHLRQVLHIGTLRMCSTKNKTWILHQFWKWWPRIEIQL
jgi:hypothetical protein